MFLAITRKLGLAVNTAVWQPNSMVFNGDKKFGKSLLAEPEKRLKAWLLPHVPPQLGTHHLTLMTLPWSALVIAFSFLARYNIHWLHAVSLMIVLQYVTDLMDGAVCTC